MTNAGPHCTSRCHFPVIFRPWSSIIHSRHSDHTTDGDLCTAGAAEKVDVASSTLRALGSVIEMIGYRSPSCRSPNELAMMALLPVIIRAHRVSEINEMEGAERV